MSMFSPADLLITMRLPTRKSMISLTATGRRSISTSSGNGTSAMRFTSSIAPIGILATLPLHLLQIEGFLHELIGRRNDSRVGLIAALHDDQVREFPRHISSRRL